MFATLSLVVILAILLLDLLWVSRRPHLPSMRESAIWVGVYAGLALIFCGLLWVVRGQEPATQFLAGWLTEYTLSIDNLFVFLVILSGFAVPRRLQQQVLMVGIVIALVLRGGFILVGAAMIERAAWVFYLFGAFLLLTALHQLRGALRTSPHTSEPGLAQRLAGRLDVVDQFDGMRLRTRVDGRMRYTPMLAVLLALGLTDLMFAVDSIPAIFGITQDPFLVMAANVFALMGLRQLYFLLGGMLDRLVYLAHGIALVLGFIGVKLVLHALGHNHVPFINGGEPFPVPQVSTGLSLGVIAVVLTVSVLLSLLSTAGRRAAEASRKSSARDTADVAGEA